MVAPFVGRPVVRAARRRNVGQRPIPSLRRLPGELNGQPRTRERNGEVDRRTQQGIPEDAQINIANDHEVHYWTARFGCTSRQLRDAVQLAGSKAKDVLAYLRAHADG